MRKRKRRQSATVSETSSTGRIDILPADSSPCLPPRDPLPVEDDGCPVRSLSPGEGLVFLGCSKLTVLQGSIKVMGKIVNGGDKSVAMSTHGMGGAGIALTALEGCGEMPLKDIESTFKVSQETVRPQLHPVFSNGSPACYLFPGEWELGADAVLKQVQTHSRVVVLIQGDKGTGKSTFFRFMVNSLLNRTAAVAAMELDIGQPEFQTPGQMSLALVDAPLLGAPVTHKVEARESVFYGATDAMRDPDRYLSSVRYLFGRWQELWLSVNEGKPLPLVVNTCGCTTGIQEVVQLETVSALQPTHVFHFCSKGSGRRGHKKLSLLRKTEEVLSKKGATGRVTVLCSMAKKNISYFLSELSKEAKTHHTLPEKMPKDRGLLLFLKWAAQCLGQSTEHWKWSNKATTELVTSKLGALSPWRINLRSVIVECLFGDVDQEALLQAMNGAIIGMSAASGSHLEVGDKSKIRKCLGIGLVRSIDPETGSIFVLTDLEGCTLAKVDVIQIGIVRVAPELCMTEVHHPSFLVPKGLVNEVF